MVKHSLIAGVALAALVVGRAPAAAPAYGSWGFDAAGEDRAVKPGDNFFAYANGTAVKNLVIPADHTVFGSFNVLRDLSEQRVHGLLDAAAATAPETPADTVQKTGAFYKAFMAEAAVETLGARPLGPDLALIEAVRTPAQFASLIGRAQTTFLGSLFDTSIAPDPKDPNAYSIQLGQSGLGMPDRDYYSGPQFAAKRAKYPAFVTRMLTLAGWPNAAADAPKVIAFETEIAKASWTRADRRDADKTYNPTTLAALKKSAPGFDWDSYFAAAGLDAPARVVLGENTAIVRIAALAAATPIDTLRAWSAYHLAIDAAPVLPRAMVDTNFEFFSHELQGQPAQKPRWKRGVQAVDQAMGEAVGQAYVAQYYPPDARAKMEALTHDLRDAFRVRLAHNEWMTPQTREKALAKLATFDFQIGYPKKWRDYSTLLVKADDAYGNAERATAFEWQFWVNHLGKPVDHDQWEMAPQTVNAYNEPVFNEVVFPAAILQPPFFDKNADPAINYGAIGGVIGHEMTHSFDDQGRKYDLHGKLDDWWTAADTRAFDARAKIYGAQFAAMEILPGARINPELTMGENIADLGGLTLALDAYHASLHGKKAAVIDGTTGDQRVFLGWAQVWRAKVRDDAARQYLVVDPHSPPVARVNGPMHNIDAWYKAFAVKPGDALYLSPANRVKIW